ncbi:hypothetical protein T492DRAFT_974601 [Pavlovales sp. CCMP2436]|nr:hypothetical protein T492DRAFT_974601 [Pavlovales sp. CCMP2436]
MRTLLYCVSNKTTNSCPKKSDPDSRLKSRAKPRPKRLQALPRRCPETRHPNPLLVFEKELVVLHKAIFICCRQNCNRGEYCVYISRNTSVP